MINLRMSIRILVVFGYILFGTGLKVCNSFPSSEGVGINEFYFDEMYVGKYIQDVCEEDLFSARDAYDSCHYLMIPMKWAFVSGDKTALASFEKLFEKFFYQGINDSNFSNLNRLTKNHWVYLASEYFCLCKEYGYPYNKESVNGIISYICQEHDNYRGNWAAYRRYNNFFALLDGILFGSGYESKNSMNNVITDNDLFPLAILCNLNYIIDNEWMGISARELSIIRKSQWYVDNIMFKCVEWNDFGGWLFQPGAWDDSHSWDYSGYNRISEIIPGVKKREANVAWDTSHFQRFPVFLHTFKRNAEDKDFYDKIIKGLALQITRAVVRYQNGYYVMSNFMDGRNGVYQYNPENGTGVDAFEASCSILTGWWSQLYDEKVADVYRKTYAAIKDVNEMPNVYFDSLTIRRRNPKLVSLRWYKLMLYCACYLCQR